MADSVRRVPLFSKKCPRLTEAYGLFHFLPVKIDPWSFDPWFEAKGFGARSWFGSPSLPFWFRFRFWGFGFGEVGVCATCHFSSQGGIYICV